MGGSRRRLKRGKPKVRVRLPKIRKPAPSKVQLPDGEIVEWDRNASLRRNYGSAGLLLDPFKVKPKGDKERPAGAGGEGAESASGEGGSGNDGQPETPLSHELLATLGEVKRNPDLPPPRLTRMQRVVIGRLLAVHGTDYKAMSMDIKRNRMQHSPSQLRLLCERYLATEKTLPDPS
eukprot:TRINITY_DN80730_c0_g1_i1.p1 TRINITY_DN80730_c0_g1~~TRINITY_DN80730_c0_g1_i1.p1  ORF type:complete len:177 (+),score=4.34 TRINITY_DN80730_c0_g1_i1:162-692(+)